MIRTVVDEERGCGWRQEGGTYLMAGPPSWACGRLPASLERCPTCDQGIKPSRGWTWVNPGALFANVPCRRELVACHASCPLAAERLLSGALGRAGLLWIGGSFYPTPWQFMSEASRLGISRRLAQVPKGLEIGKTWVLLAHRHAIEPPVTAIELANGAVVLEPHTPGIFSMFRPDRIEYVVKGDETPEELERLERRGLELVKVERAGQQALETVAAP